MPFPGYMDVWDPRSPPTSARTVKVAITTRVVNLQWGDYALEGHEGGVIIERKKNLDELYKNLCTRQGRRRFLAELDALGKVCRFPYVMLEGDPLEMNGSIRYAKGANPVVVRDALLRCCMEARVTLLMMPCSSVSARRAFGEWAASLLISGQLIPESVEPEPPPTSPFPVPLPS